MAVNQYLPFAAASGANVLAPADYAALSSRTAGFVAGIALSEYCNTVWRQSSVGVAMIGDFVSNIGGFDALDDGDVHGLAVKFENTLQSGKLIYGSDSSSDPNAMVITLITPVTMLTPGLTVRVKKSAAANTSACTLDIGLGANTVTRAGGAATQAGDIPANALLDFCWDGGKWQMVNYQGLSSTETNNNTYTLTIPYCQDTSVVANTITAPFSPAIVSLAAGDMIKIKLANSITGPATATVNALAPIALVRPDGSPLRLGDAFAGQILILEFDGVNLQMVNLVMNPGFARGSIYMWPTNAVPAGTFECNGAAVSRTTYAALFAIIGTSYGPGDGSTTFNLPDYRGMFLRGWSHGSGVDPDAASRTNRGDGTTGDFVGTRQADALYSTTALITSPEFNWQAGEIYPWYAVGTDGASFAAGQSPIAISPITASPLVDTPSGAPSANTVYPGSSAASYMPSIKEVSATMGNPDVAGIVVSSISGTITMGGSPHETRPKNVNVMFIIAY